jgi:hypothetical protein
MRLIGDPGILRSGLATFWEWLIALGGEGAGPPAGPPQGWEVTEAAGRETTPSLQEPTTHLSLVHFTAGAGSPTELQGRRTSFIQGVVTVPPKEMIFAGAIGKRG